jgi:Trp operon repressor
VVVGRVKLKRLFRWLMFVAVVSRCDEEKKKKRIMDLLPSFEEIEKSST